METTSKRPTIVTKLQREQYIDLLPLVHEEVFLEFNASIDKATKRLKAEISEAMRTAGSTIMRDGQQFKRLLAQLRFFQDGVAQPRA